MVAADVRLEQRADRLFPAALAVPDRRVEDLVLAVLATRSGRSSPARRRSPGRRGPPAQVLIAFISSSDSARRRSRESRCRPVVVHAGQVEGLDRERARGHAVGVERRRALARVPRGAGDERAPTGPAGCGRTARARPPAGGRAPRCRYCTAVCTTAPSGRGAPRECPSASRAVRATGSVTPGRAVTSTRRSQRGGASRPTRARGRRLVEERLLRHGVREDGRQLRRGAGRARRRAGRRRRWPRIARRAGTRGRANGPGGAPGRRGRTAGDRPRVRIAAPTASGAGTTAPRGGGSTCRRGGAGRRGTT